MAAQAPKGLNQLLGEVEDARLDFDLLLRAFDQVADGPAQDREAPPWLWTVSRHWDRLGDALTAYLEALPGTRLSVVEGGQGVICPFNEPSQMPEPPADG